MLNTNLKIKDMRTAKNIFLVFVATTLTIFTSCKRQEHDIQPNTDPHTISLGVSMEMIQSKKSTNAEHNYVTTGYKVGVEGALVDGQQDHFENIDL
ncbi:MAG: hypothetical protein KAG37_02260, partial [Flavobacteriales bacterium]|nr:hypothetical protein [Flavobacteriales bacterium]